MNLSCMTRSLVFAIALACALSSSPVAAASSPERWEAEIRQFEVQDKIHPPKPGSILFTGSSSIRMWQTLEADFPRHAVLGRGFGGSEMSDLVHFADRIVIPYAPRHILVYEGDNDLAAGKTPEQVLKDFQNFVARVRTQLPRVRIDYIAIKPSRARWHLLDKIKATNGAIARWSRTQRRVGSIDIFTPMLSSSGELKADLFREDGLHLNAKGYALWTDIIRKRL